LKGLLVESVVMLGSLAAAAMALRVLWARVQLTSATDPAGLPLLLMTAGAVSLAATPLLNAWSRRNERRADRVALDLTERPEAFIAVIRRMAAQNLAEEHPPRVARWLLNTHPTVDARIGQARRFSEARQLAAAQAARAAPGPSSAARTTVVG
jgi:STE24 endopeptidase